MHLGPRVLGVQVLHHLGRALAGAEHREALMLRLRHLGEVEQELMVVEAPRRRSRPLGQAFPQSGTNHDIPGTYGATVREHDLEALDGTAFVDPLHRGDRGAVVDIGVDLCGRPLQIVLELHPGGEEGLVVDEIDEAAALVQVGEEGVATTGVPKRDQVLGEGDLHGRTVEHHALMPAERLLLLEEAGTDPVGRRAVGVVLLDRDREREVRRPEPDPDQVERLLRPERGLARRPLTFSHRSCPSSWHRPGTGPQCFVAEDSKG